MLLVAQPDDLVLANRIAEALCAEGRFADSLPFLRRAAPVLGHRDSALWNYTTALAVSGSYHELLAIEPMLIDFSRDSREPFSPFVHLVAAKLALRFDRAAVARETAARQGASGWLDAAALAAELQNAIHQHRAFSVLTLSHAHARLVVYASLRNHLELSRAEMSAVVNSVWVESFGETIEQHGTVPAGALTRDLMAAIAEADVIALPDDGLLASAHEHFGYLAETQQVALQRGSTLCAGLGVLTDLHEAMPFLRPLLAEQPFLGVVGSHPDLAERLGRFCQIGETRTYLVPAALHRTDVAASLRGHGHYPGLFEQTLASVAVPYPGAVFLVAAGLLGAVYCDRIKQLGGIAIDIDALIGRWMPA